MARTYPIHGTIEGSVVIVGFGSIGRGTLPLIERHFRYDAHRIHVIDPSDAHDVFLEQRGVTHHRVALTRENYREVLAGIFDGGPGFCVNLSVDTSSLDLMKLCRELGVPLPEVKGSGPKGRITQEDLQGFVKAVMAGSVQTAAQQARAPPSAAASGGRLPGLLAWPQVDFAKFGPVERKDLSRIKKISGANLHRNWVLIPHVTNNDEADITELEAFRVQLNKENEKAGHTKFFFSRLRF